MKQILPMMSAKPIWITMFAVMALVMATRPDCLALTANLVPSADTTLFQHNPDNNLGGMDVVIAGTIGFGDHSRALMKFDIAAALPAGATVTSATLNLNVPGARGFNQSYELHRVLKDWGEGGGLGGGGGIGVQGAPAIAGEASWNARFHPATTWATPGGQSGSDFNATASAFAIMGLSTLNFDSAGMAADVQAWLDSPGTNFGWMIMIANETTLSTASRIASREALTGAPTLTIEYTVSGEPPPTMPVISTPVLESGAIRFSFNAESNHTYTVEFRDSLTTGTWAVLTNLPAQPANTTIHITNTVSSTERYFRVRMP